MSNLDTTGAYAIYLRKSRKDDYNEDISAVLKRHKTTLTTLARGNAIDQGIIQRTFFVTGTKIITPLKVYDPLNEFDEEYFEYGLFRSRSEYKIIRRRINAGRMHSVREGK